MSAFNENWELNYLICNNNDQIQCIICLKMLSVNKEYNANDVILVLI